MLVKFIFNKEATLLTIVLLLLSQAAKSQNPVWEEVAPGVWKTAVGIPDKYNLLTASGAQPNTEALAKLGGGPLFLSQQVISWPTFREEEPFCASRW